MRELLSEIQRWRDEGKAVAMATVVATWGSSPRRPGARLALTAEGDIAGSVSGGCVEGAVFEAGLRTLESGRPQLLHFGVADETAWSVGLACGGEIDIFVEPLDATLLSAAQRWLDDGEVGAVATVVAGEEALLGRRLLVDASGSVAGTLQPALDLEEGAIAAAREALRSHQGGRVTLGQEQAELFVELLLPPPTLVVVGAVHIAIPLTQMAQAAGYRTVVIDPRRAFASKERFPHVDQLLPHWPAKALQEVQLTAATAVAALTHDPKIDDPALRAALHSRAFYVGALGSSRTQEERRQRLRAAGLSEEALGRIHGPIGLDIEATTPEEIAVAILAEIVAARHGSSRPSKQ